MGWWLRFRKDEKGFSLAEILVAGLILVWGLIPVIGMFDQSFKGFRNMRKIQQSVNCAKAAMEQIRNIPFYEPHNTGNLNRDLDIDDRFWGTRDPMYSNPSRVDGSGNSVPDWDNIPKVTFYDYGAFPGYEDYKVAVQLCYLNDDTGVATMKSTWGPKVVGHDRPTNSDNRILHLLLIKVTAFVSSGGSDLEAYSLESVVTDTEAVYNLGVSSIEVVGPDSIKDPAGKPNAAAHWSNPNVDVQVIIKGWGFDAVNDADGVVQAWLVRDRMYDTPITLNYLSETELRGRMTLYSGHNESSAVNPWTPKAAIGYWSVKVRQKGVLSAYLYNGFVVQYPQPVIADFGNDPDYGKTGLNIWNNATLKIKGGPFCFVQERPAVRLVKLAGDGSVEHQVNGNVVSVTAPSGTYGYASSPSCEITATFDFTSAPPGEYRMQVVNTREPTLIGHVGSAYSSAVYVIQQMVPRVDDVYVATTGSHTAYSNVGNPWRLAIVGNYFNSSGSPPVEVWICQDVSDGLPSGNRVQGTVVSVIGMTAIVADFNLSPLPDGNYKAYVKNLNNGLAGWTAGSPFSVTKFNATIGGFVPDAGYDFYENYYDIPCKITGTGLSSASRVTITDGTVEYDLVGDYTITSDNEIRVHRLNLIGCDNTRSWRVRVYFGTTFFLEREFDVKLGPARIIAANDKKPAISIYRMGWWFSDSWSYETSTQWAAAIRSYWFGTARARFVVQGMGFPINGQTTLRVWKGSWSVSANLTCSYDRNAKSVTITSPDWAMPNDSAGDAGISVQRVGDSYVDSYPTRWRLVD